MKKLFAFICTMIIMYISYVCFQYYMSNEITILSCIFGLVGFVLCLAPAWDMWYNFFVQMFSNEEKND
jgi:hypothetical protein